MLEAVSCTGRETARRDDFHPPQGPGGRWAWEDGSSCPSAPGNELGGQQEVTQPRCSLHRTSPVYPIACPNLLAVLVSSVWPFNITSSSHCNSECCYVYLARWLVRAEVQWWPQSGLGCVMHSVHTWSKHPACHRRRSARSVAGLRRGLGSHPGCVTQCRQGQLAGGSRISHVLTPAWPSTGRKHWEGHDQVWRMWMVGMESDPGQCGLSSIAAPKQDFGALVWSGKVNPWLFKCQGLQAESVALTQSQEKCEAGADNETLRLTAPLSGGVFEVLCFCLTRFWDKSAVFCVGYTEDGLGCKAMIFLL